MFLSVNVSAQDSWTCPGTNAAIPSTGNINCTVTTQTNDDISISVSERVISTTAANTQWILGWHQGTGDVGITVSEGSITTNGQGSHGILGRHQGTGDVGITVSKGSITTTGQTTHGTNGYHTGAGDIGITISEGRITTNDQGSHGILGWHEGTGDIGITVSGGSIITTGQTAHGINGFHREAGDIRITISEGRITTNDQGSHGILGWHEGTGDIGITVSGGSIITTGQTAHGINGFHREAGDIDITVSGGSITTKGQTANGIWGLHQGTGDVGITVSGGSIITTGQAAHGTYGFHRDAGDIRITISEGSITTKDQSSHGILGWHQGTGDIRITVSGGSIATESQFSYGIYGLKQGTTGDITITVSEGSITTKGQSSQGILGWHQGTGDITIEVSGGSITTEGQNANGVIIQHVGIGSSEVVVDNITAKGVGAYGIQFGRLNDDGEIERVSAVSVDDDGNRQLVDSEGYRPQMVRINGTVRGGQASEDEDSTDGAGVFMAGGGRVTIGPEGVLGAQSGIAILAIGDNRTDEDTSEEPQRKLYVNLESTDNNPWERLAGHIVNEDGETILAVNGTNVFDSGRIDAWVPAGSLREVQLNPSEDFSTLDFSDEEDWSRRYQAHVGAYEALPGALRRIDTTACHVPTQQNYIGVCGGWGQYTPDQTTTGMSYSYNQQALYGHIMRPLSEQVSGWAGLRQVSGEANVNIAAGSSRVTVRGVGVHGGVQVMGDTDLYGQAHLQWTRYTLNLVSGAVRGTTKGTAWSLGLEGGRHFRVDDETRVTGRGWLKHANVSVTPFEDSLGLRVSGQERRVIAGVGVQGEREMVHENEGRRVVLSGSAGIETAVSEASTVMVDDEVLSSQAKATRLLLDVGGVLHQGDTEFHGMVYAHGLGADDTSYGLRLGLEWSF